MSDGGCGWRLLGLCGIIAALLLAGCVPDVVRHNEAGNAHFDDEAYIEALDDYRLAQVDEPDYPEPYYNAANSYNRQGEIEGALAQTQQALKTADPDLAAQAWYNLGNAYFDAQQWQPAIEAYKESLRLIPEDQDAKHNLELALQRFQEQQAQQQQQQQSQDQQQDQQQSGEQDQQQEPSEQQQPGEQEQEQAQQEPGEQEGAAAEPQQMTPEQAAQLLQAILGDAETLQERLQEIHRAPGPAPEEDW